MVESGSVSIIVDNLWLRPDGEIQSGLPQALESPAFLPDWMIRNEGWARVARNHDALTVEFDPRCLGTGTLNGLLDAIRETAARHSIRSIKVLYHDTDRLVAWHTDSALRACWFILRMHELVNSFDDARYLLFQERQLKVETQCLDADDMPLSTTASRMQTFLDNWRDCRASDQLIQRLDGDSQHISLYRLEDGEPRAILIGGGLLFGTANAKGARLNDILPGAQALATRDRIITAVRSGQPVLRRHNSAEYDVLALSVPALHKGEVVSLTMSQSSRRSAFRHEASVPYPAGFRNSDDPRTAPVEILSMATRPLRLRHSG